MKIRRVLVADRGPVACRILQTVHRLGLASVAMPAGADREVLLAAARSAGADAVHPGGSLLAADADFAQAVADAGLTWIGPGPDAMRTLFEPARAQELAHAFGIPCRSGNGGAQPPQARHVGVQVVADMHGRCLHLGECDGSVRHGGWPLLQESPSPGVDASLRERLGAHAVELARAAGFAGVGTVEFLLDAHGRFWLLGMDPRPELALTEMVTGLDLVEWQLRLAGGERLPYRQEHLNLQGHAVAARLGVDDESFGPQTGRVQVFRPPPAGEGRAAAARLRFDHALSEGAEVGAGDDAFLGLLVAHGARRDEAIARLLAGLDALQVLGVPTNRRRLAACLRHPEFAAGQAGTDFLARHGGALRAELDSQEFRAAPDAALALLLPQGPAGELAAPFPRPWRVRHQGDLLDLPVCEADGVAVPPAQVALVGPRRWHVQSGAVDLFLEDASYDPPAGAGPQWGP